jgi:hypothetical protein
MKIKWCQHKNVLLLQQKKRFNHVETILVHKIYTCIVSMYQMAIPLLLKLLF